MICSLWHFIKSLAGLARHGTARHAPRVSTPRTELRDANAARSQSAGPLRVTSTGTVTRGTEGGDYVLCVVHGETFRCTCPPLCGVIGSAEGSASERLPTQCANSRALAISFRSENNLQFFIRRLAARQPDWTPV